MKFVCSQTELNTALQQVSRAVASRPTHPVLANVLLTADQGTGRLSLTGFDLNLGIQNSLPASVEKSGAITLPAKLLGEIVSRLSSESPLTLTSDETGENVELISLSGTYQMKGMSSEDFPELPLVETGTSFYLNPSNFVDAIKGTLFASSSDEAKQLLTGIHLKFNGQTIEAAATDGHRLAVLNIDNAINNNLSTESLEEPLTDNFSVTLPSRSLREVERLISYNRGNESIRLFSDRGQVVFLAEDQVVTSRTLEGNYPNYSQLIPETFSRKLSLDRRSFIAALERVGVLADQHNNVIKITTGENAENIKITVDAQDVGSGSESLPVKLDGDAIQIAFNVRYLLDGLKAIETDRVILQCNSPTTPAILIPEDLNIKFTYLVMPIQVRS